MKKLLFITLFLTTIWSSFAGDVPLASSHGTYSTPGGLRTRSTTPAVIATLEEDYLQVKFNRDLSVVTTTIYNESGEVVYENETVTGYGVVEIIDTIDFEEGNYTIVLTNNYGLHLEGNFVL